MARNEEKQQGRLNRLWLQKEREEGRIRDVQEQRPKLSTLTSAASVKKWIPSIKNDIEYYLQVNKATSNGLFKAKPFQSQLSHYPERKIAEFQQNIEALEKEYKKFITKLRVFDPSCKHKPWTARPYSKRRTETVGSEKPAKDPRHSKSQDNHSESSDTPTTPPRLVHSNLTSQCPESECPDQDQPLSFDKTRLAIATAGVRHLSHQVGSCQEQSLARMLQTSLPNLTNSLVDHRCSSGNSRTQKSGRTVLSLESGHKRAIPTCSSGCEATERTTERSLNSSPTRGRTGHVLGLDCYSSSDEEDT